MSFPSPSQVPPPPSQPLQYAVGGTITSYDGNHGRAKGAVILIYCVMAATCLGILADLCQIGFRTTTDEGEITFPIPVIILSLANLPIYFVCFITSTVFFLRWLHRAYRNLIPLGAVDLKYTPRWACWYWFIPFVNLVRPYQAVRELLYLSTSTQPQPRGTSATNSTVPKWISSWWGLWLVANFVGNASARMSASARTGPELTSASALGIASSLALIGSGFFAIRLIWAVQAGQAERSRLA